MSAWVIVPKGDVKMLRETLCMAQAALRSSSPGDAQIEDHVERLSALIRECDRHRPLGSDGKHGDRHTETCGCER